MPARRIKTLFRNPRERNHREHRSKRGRNPNHRCCRFQRIKSVLNDRKQKEQELWELTKEYVKI